MLSRSTFSIPLKCVRKFAGSFAPPRILLKLSSPRPIKAEASWASSTDRHQKAWKRIPKFRRSVLRAALSESFSRPFGSSPKGLEKDSDKAARKTLLRNFGYKVK